MRVNMAIGCMDRGEYSHLSWLEKSNPGEEYIELLAISGERFSQVTG
jgi:hypothetical protein